MENFLKDLNLLILPSTLWGIHIDPKTEFMVILHVNLASSRVNVDKTILLTQEEAYIKATVFLNDELVQIPNTTGILSGISDLSSLLYTLHEVKFCVNYNNSYQYPQCSKYIANAEVANFCDFCALDVFNNEIKDCDEGDNDSTNLLENEVFNNFKEKDGYVDCNTQSEGATFVNCEVCNEEFSSNEVLIEHKSSKHGNKERNKLCTVCGKTFNCPSSLENHMLTHSNKKPFVCSICDKEFAKKYNLNVHLRVHSGERPYVCSKCGKTFATRSNFLTHMKSAHTEVKKYPCEFCDMTFVYPRVLKIHMRKHTGEKPYNCKICGKVFAKNIHLKIHTRTHTGEKPHICPVCGKGFITSGNLNGHRKAGRTCEIKTI